ncbi:MAG TPA: 4-hydroxy-tetrahydrodipicolinate synthase [Actinobacteria bacterium]|nr:4-hydroxy-tetrahydrodipicolinate synthase [Actinomycetota bacterium]
MAKDFSGCHVPLITPFKEDLALDEPGLRELVNHFIEVEKVDGLVPCGTTGESPTLTNEEHDRVIEVVVKETDGRVPVIAGTGSNSTQEAIIRTKHAESVGADASLQVAPYYNKPTQEGMIAHFEAIAAATNLPIIIYNIPSRSGQNIEPRTIIDLAKIDNIIGVKDAAGDLNQTMALLNALGLDGKGFYLLSGEDAMTFSIMCLGGHGTISAVANVIGREFTEMCAAVKNGRIEEAKRIHYEMLPLVKALFIETNPVPVKEALGMMGLPSGPPRLPLVPLKAEHRAMLAEVLRRAGRLPKD